MPHIRFSTKGLSLIEALIVIAIMVIIFGALFGGTRYSLELIAHSRAKLSALSLANDRMELFRSFPYNDVGTIGGIPAGTIPQISTTTLNGYEFVERVLVEYVDDPADGLLTATTTDSNGIPSDYKRIKIEISWNVYDKPGKLALVSNIVPRSIETTEGGGTVRVNVIDQDSLPLENAVVRLINNDTSNTIDITKYSDASGVVLFSGAPAASNYELVVTAEGYSTHQTHAATTSNPNPSTAPFAVLEADISTLTFQIDELSDVNINAYSSIDFDSSDESFTDASGISTSTNTVITGGTLALQNNGSGYDGSGSAYLSSIVPSSILGWESATIAVTKPAGTDYGVQFFTASGTSYELIPDGDLPNNSTGFSSSVISLGTIDPTLYPNLAVGIFLESTNSMVTPSVDELRIFYRTSETPLTSSAISIHGNKVIGTDSEAKPIYKLNTSVTTDGSGEAILTDTEFDSYTLDIINKNIAYVCPSIPFNHRGGVDSNVELQVVSDHTNSLLIKVLDNTGVAVPGAEVTLESASSSYSGTEETTPCGGVYFGPLQVQSDYKITVTKPGYETATIESFSVEEESSTLVILNSLW